MTIGQLAKKVGVNPQTLRFYEREGLLPPPCRQGSGNYRDYDQHALNRMRFITSAKGAGFTLVDIKKLLDAPFQEEPCGNVVKLVEGRLSELDRRIEELKGFRKHLARLQQECEANGGRRKCPAIDSFTDESGRL